MRDDFRRDDDFCCCKDEIAALLKELADDVCPVELRLVTGSDCCRLEGIICDVIKNNCILVIIDCKDNAKCFVPIDKIAAICKICPGEKKKHHRPRDVEE